MLRSQLSIISIRSIWLSFKGPLWVYYSCPSQVHGWWGDHERHVWPSSPIPGSPVWGKRGHQFHPPIPVSPGTSSSFDFFTHQNNINTILARDREGPRFYFRTKVIRGSLALAFEPYRLSLLTHPASGIFSGVHLEIDRISAAEP